MKILARIQRSKNHGRTARIKGSDQKSRKKRIRQELKNTRILPESHDLFFRPESCIEGMVKDSCMKIKKNKNLERSEARSPTSVYAL
jgi:hypothetical protein